MIGITTGDPTGIGPEVVLKALTRFEQDNVVLIGPLSVIEEEKRKAGISDIPEVVDIGNGLKILPKRPSKEGGEIAYRTLIRAIDLLKSGKITSLVTAPVSKKAINLAGYSFQGHTELLATAFSVQKYAMFFHSEKMNIALVTRHIPLFRVAKELSIQRIYDTVKLTHRFLSSHQKVLKVRKSPIIGVLGLNPHAGEGGDIGDEEERIILPAINRAKREGMDVKGPLVPDTAYRESFGAYVAMYHDQGLIPLKLLKFETAVNITLGLPFIRTSPSHGTAYNIAGKEIADQRGMEEAINLAIKLSSSFY